MKNKKIVLLVDGDVIAFRAAAAVEKRSIIVKHIPTGIKKDFANRTEFRALLKSKDKEETEVDYLIKDIQTPKDTPEFSAIESCMYNMRSMIKKMQDLTEADETEIYIGGKENFRTKLALPEQYKGNRVDLMRPLYLDNAKNYLMSKMEAVKSIMVEADDVLSIRGYEELSKGNIAIIGTNDKDTLQGEGLCMYDPTVEAPEVFEIPEIGWLTKNKSIIKGCGLKFFAFQLLFGDGVDNYKPCALAGVKYGQVAAFNDLDDLFDPTDILKKVISKYKEWYPKPFSYKTWDGKVIEGATWETMLDLMFKCAYMKRSWNDPSDWKLFFKAKGVNLEQ